ncbi:hypothetical protein JOB18_028599 [Solea senegalensis]|uniref:Integrin alpha-M-like n=1 Tax=Solea senegalensis TaxID=28829 RepID=A0AAV6Q883_SOLSE|nr:integrin alpha-D [Solea senegalensis]KAG7486286.1 integrin alpha-M-like [Solea senegalensis]KAG7486287.1 hypothetical protein JOB18_028599 [Solea senegalensis]
MQEKCRLFLFTSLLALAMPLSLAFNIDMTKPDVYTGEQKDFFGYKVLQFISDTDKGIIVTAPLQLNGSGGVCKVDRNQSTFCFNSEDKTNPVKHLGLSIAADSANSQFTVCSPNVAHECNENSYLSGVCYKITDQLKQISNFTPAFQECTKKTVDLVFLFDGSNSMTTDEFNNNKVFIKDIMKSLRNTSIKFAAVQFSSDPRTVFDFNDDQAGRAVGKLEKEPHMKMLTCTYKALKFVLETIFENPAVGASPDATKVLVMITDGDPSDSNSTMDIQRYVEKHIIRFVIAVKDAKLDKFTDIASKPTDKYAFKIENYKGLTGILETFQKKIFIMEGSSVARGGHMENEMSQSGSSAAFHNDTLILGSVGSKTWRGSLQELQEQKERQIEDPRMQNDSYLGYSISVGQMANTPLYFTGAPRFRHTGQVVLFKRDGTEWTVAQRLDGDQIGSYFGAELCSVDIDSDGTTDFLLVGAPMFYQPQDKREGQVYVYTVTDEIQLNIELKIAVPSVGRFGTTISSLADLNGDRLRDVAVGAPLEDENRGAVYIYLGDKCKGIRSTFSQRISAQEINPRLRLFGQAIDGGIDLGEDGLPDVVIGSQGTAVCLRSRPVVNVTTHVSFQPKVISTERFDCVAKTDEMLPMGNLTACFKMVETTKSKAGVMSLGMNISYMLNVDPMRQMYRGFFGGDNKARNLTSTFNLKDVQVCFSYNISMPKCVKDTLMPISIKLNFSQVDSERTRAVLNVDSRSQDVIEVPFEKQCAKDDTCIAELEVDFNFTTPTLLVAEENYLNVMVKLSNHGDDSYNTSLTMYYPPGLSFSMMTLTEATKQTLHSCSDLEALDKTICGISLPVYRSRSAATFHSSFYIISGYEWNDTLSMTITGRSDNTNITTNSSLTRVIPVQFEIRMVVTVKEETTTYLNFTSDDDAPKKVQVIYKISNQGWKSFPVNVSLFFPTKLEHNFEMTDYQVSVQQNKSQCSVSDVDSENCSPDKNCKAVACDTFTLEKESDTEVLLSGNVQFKDLKKHAENIAFLKRYTGDSAEVQFKSFIHVTCDRKRYVLDSRQRKSHDGFTRTSSPESSSWKDNDPTRKRSEVRVEFIIPPNQQLIIVTGVVLGVFLLIIITIIMFKLGCFKRKKYYDDQEEAAALQGDALMQPASPAPTIETEDKPEPPSEDKVLLDDVEANGISSTFDTQEALEETTEMKKINGE